MSFHKLDIQNVGLTSNRARVTLDGHPLDGLIRLELSMGVDEVTRVTLELLVDDINVDAEAEVG